MTTTKKREEEGEGEGEEGDVKATPARKKDTVAAKALEELDAKRVKNREKNIIRDIDR